MPKRKKATNSPQPASTEAKASSSSAPQATASFKLARYEYDNRRDFGEKEEKQKHEHESEVKDATEKLQKYQQSQAADSQELQQLFKDRNVETSERKKAAIRWGVHYTDATFRDVGKTSYAVPHFYIGKSALKPREQGAFLGPPQTSDLRSDNAERLVFRAFWLLSNKLEEEEGGGGPMFIMTNVLYENVLITAPDREKKSKYFTFNPKDQARKESDLLILHKQKGIIFVQVKAFDGQHQQTSLQEKMKTVRKQLQNDEDVFKKIMDFSDGVKQPVHQVWALPCLSEKDAKDIKDKDMVLLSKDDLFDDRTDVAESEYPLENFRDWWNKLPNKPISEFLMKDIIARYIGPFSRPRDTNFTTERSHARTVCDSVALACKYVRSWCMSEDDKKKWKELDKEKRVHLQGPPGSGRTAVLVQKAVTFLTKHSRGGHVAVVDLCRGLVKYKGSLGRPVCSQIIAAVKNAPGVKDKCEGNVHHCPLNLHQSADLSELKALKGNKDQILFIIDEILPQKEWDHVLQHLNNKFKDSHVWCADGIIPQTLDKTEKFHTVELSQIYRIPASVQRILRFVDFMEERKERYLPDVAKQGGQQILSTNGPTPVCIRHADHNPQQPVIECDRCVQELATVLKAMGMVAEAGGKAGGSQGRAYLPCSIAVLFGLPEYIYTDVRPSGEKPKYVETTEHGFQEYEEKVLLFVKKLQRHLQENVSLLSPSGKGKDLDALWDDIVVSWTDFFMGLERDVVIYLPGDTARKGDPTPDAAGVKTRSTSPSASTSTASAKSSRTMPMPGFSKRPLAKMNLRQKDMDAGTKQPLAKLYWRQKDMDAYTDCDLSNLMCAATRCCGQLILLTP